MQTLLTHGRRYIAIAALLAGGYLASRGFEQLYIHILPHLGESSQMLGVFLELMVIAVFGFLAYEVAKPTVIPSFVLAVFIGITARGSLQVIVQNTGLLTTLTTLGAVFILFGGGLDTPFARFKTLIGPILSVAFVGTLVTAILFTMGLMTIGTLLGFAVPLAGAVIVGSALASTDPAAIIPSFRSLAFRNPRVKYIAVSESAINDVVGAVLTGVFLMVFTAGGEAAPQSISNAYASLLSRETGMDVIWELLIGGAVGVIGFAILHGWNQWKTRFGTGGEADAALFLAVPLFCYSLATALHGSGFLAVFISSLLFHIDEHFRPVEHYFNHTIEAFMKPLIFMLLGASVDVRDLLAVAPLGIAMGVLFMAVIRPFAVFLTLSPFMRGKHKMTARELLFLSFVRETGVIPAVLLIGLKAASIEGSDMVIAVGLWVILLTLIIQPAFTPLVAKKLGIAANAAPFPHTAHKGQVAVLCSRGDSFIGRLRTVADWASRHAVASVVVLHCPESKYSPEYSKAMHGAMEKLGQVINAEMEAQGHSPLKFEFIGRQGLLQENVESFTKENDAAIIFVGNKMLDYRLEDVKRLSVPFVFLA